MGFIIHFSDFDAFEGIHEFQQEADAAFKALHLCDNLPIFGIFYPTGQLQSFCHLRQLDAKADLLYTSVEGDITKKERICQPSFEKIFLRVRLGRFTFSFFCIIIKITYGIMPAIWGE